MTQTASIFRSILVPLDGSPFAEQVIPLASRIAQRTGGKLRLTLVHEMPSSPLNPATAARFTATRKAERAYLRGVQGKLQEGGAQMSSAVTMLTGATGPALAKFVQEMGIDLAVMATHGRGGLQRAWLGSVADYMIHNIKVPVLLLRPREVGSAGNLALGTGQILVPLDGSPLAEEALKPAAALARALDAEITLIQVVRPVQLAENMVFPFPSSFDEEITALERRQAQDYLDDMIEGLQEEGIRASGVAVVGWSTVQCILDAARPGRVAFVVVATHGRGGLSRLALGSVADKLVRGADVPVMVCRPVSRGKTRKRSPRRSGSRAVMEGR